MSLYELGAITASTGTNWADGACDAAGNMTTIPKPNDLANGYTATYDAWNRLVKIVDASTLTTVAEYEYDGLNQRIQKVVGADTYDYYYNMKWQAVVEFKNGSANRLNLFSAEYIDALAVTVTATARHFYTHDANYNVTSAITPSASTAERYSYSPYGKVTVRDADFSADADGKSDIGNEFLFTGRRLDPETGFYQFRNRYYSAETGRFVNRDPIRYNGSKWNLYGAYFVPGGVDPGGEACVTAGVGGWSDSYQVYAASIKDSAPTLNPSTVAIGEVKTILCIKCRTYSVWVNCSCTSYVPPCFWETNTYLSTRKMRGTCVSVTRKINGILMFAGGTSFSLPLPWKAPGAPAWTVWEIANGWDKTKAIRLCKGKSTKYPPTPAFVPPATVPCP